MAGHGGGAGGLEGLTTETRHARGVDVGFAHWAGPVTFSPRRAARKGPQKAAVTGKTPTGGVISDNAATGCCATAWPRCSAPIALFAAQSNSASQSLGVCARVCGVRVRAWVMGWRGVRESTYASSVHVRAAVGACPIAVTPACTYTRQQMCESRGYTIIDEAWRRESWRWRDRKRVTTVPRPRPPMAPRKPSFPKPILPRPIVKPAGGAKCCAWMRAHPYQKRCFRRRGPRHITERRHAATPSSLNRWLAHPIPPAL